MVLVIYHIHTPILVSINNALLIIFLFLLIKDQIFDNPIKQEDYMDNLHSTFPPLSAELEQRNYVVKFQSLLYKEEFTAMKE